MKTVKKSSAAKGKWYSTKTHCPELIPLNSEEEQSSELIYLRDKKRRVSVGLFHDEEYFTQMDLGSREWDATSAVEWRYMEESVTE